MKIIEQKLNKWADNRLKYLSWSYFSEATIEQRLEQMAFQEALRQAANCQFNGDCYVSEDAYIYPDNFIIGNKTFICGGSIIRGSFEAGDDCCIGSYSHIAGNVKLGSHVMIAGGASIYGFNHGMETDRIIGHQPCSSKGIIIGDNCWIGASVTIVDGVTVGANSIVAAGAVVTKNIPDWSVAGGVPAKVIKNRK